jgi:hypothetical protein
MLLTIIRNAGFRVVYSKLDDRFHLDGIDTLNLGTDISCKSVNDIIRIINQERIK